MGKIVNLRQARKRKAREATETTAVTNRSLHGVSKRQRTAANVKNTLDRLQFDGRRLDPKKKD
jgi:hypothetical protein